MGDTVGEKMKDNPGNNRRVDRFAKLGPQAVSGFLFRLLSRQYLEKHLRVVPSWERKERKVSIYHLVFFLVFTQWRDCIRPIWGGSSGSVCIPDLDTCNKVSQIVVFTTAAVSVKNSSNTSSSSSNTTSAFLCVHDS